MIDIINKLKNYQWIVSKYEHDQMYDVGIAMLCFKDGNIIGVYDKGSDVYIRVDGVSVKKDYLVFYMGGAVVFTLDREPQGVVEI